MLFIESERMASCLYDPGRLRIGADGHHLGAAGRRERSGHAARPGADRGCVQGPPVPPSRRSAGCPICRPMTRDDLYGYYRRFYVPNNATLVIVGDIDTREAMRRVRRGTSAASRPATSRGARHTKEPAQDGRAARDASSREGTTAYLEARLPRAGGRRRGVLPDARARRRAHGREGRQPVGELPHAAAAAQRAAVSCARRTPASPRR